MTTPEEKHYLKSNRKLIFFFQIGKITYIGILTLERVSNILILLKK